MQRSWAVELWVAFAAGYIVDLLDPSEDAGKRALDYLLDVRKLAKLTNSRRPFGKCNVYMDSQSGSKRRQLKIDTMAELDRDICGLYFRVEFVFVQVAFCSGETESGERRLVRSTHYSVPSQIRTVRLITDGETTKLLFKQTANSRQTGPEVGGWGL